jgi:hypothetical protein
MKKFYLVFVLFHIGNVFSQANSLTLLKTDLFEDEIKNSSIDLSEKTFLVL